MNLSDLSGDERIIAEHAVLAFQAVRQAAREAPHGQGMARMEQALAENGFETLRKMLALSASDHSEAQKKGSAAKSVGAATR